MNTICVRYMTNANNAKIQCRMCKRWFDHLGSHVTKKHKISAKEYRMHFGLQLNHPMISESVRKKKQEAFNDEREKYMKNLLKYGKRYQFKKGQNKKTYWSQEEMEKVEARIKEVNKQKAIPESCPVCKVQTNHLESHLYNAHGLLKVWKGQDNAKIQE